MQLVEAHKKAGHEHKEEELHETEPDDENFAPESRELIMENALSAIGKVMTAQQIPTASRRPGGGGGGGGRGGRDAGAACAESRGASKGEYTHGSGYNSQSAGQRHRLVQDR